MKRVLIKIRTSIKFFILVALATFLVVGVVAFIYKPIYNVELNGEHLGYCAKKSQLQTKIEQYIENGDGQTSNIAYVELENIPTYSLCLLKRDITPNDDEIYQKVIETGTPYYKYYAILEDDEEKIYVSNFETAEKVVEELKQKNSDNIDDISVLEKYETELKDFVQSEQAVASLYKEKVEEQKNVKIAKTNTKKDNSSKTTNTTSSATKNFSTSSKISQSKVSLGVSFIKPITGTISSRFGSSSRLRVSRHTGLDIANSKGTPIKAAAEGTVIWSGTKGSLGKLIVISHTNGVQTYYGHCSSLYASVGQKVSQGEVIAAVGSTGNSTGPHLHFEIRVNGVAYNPQNYVY